MVLPILCVRDAEASVKFYVEVLEFSELFRMPGEGIPIAFAMVNLGEKVNVGLSQVEAPEPKGQGCIFMMYLADDADIDAYYDRVKSRGASITKEICDEYWGDRCFMIQDPDGFKVQLCKTIKRMEMDEIVDAAKG